ncbi:MAG: helix-turn-helix transcriptional regulator [Oscillospiraceae bacterium]|nr:helix-turn-helix transcriptional regulator [Oscillospiraceae bacterium]
MTNVKKDCDCSKSFAEILTNLMKERETTQKELAEHIGITRQAISQYTKGITQPTADIIVRIAKFFNVSTDYLLGVVSEKSADMDIQGACKFFGVSEKTVQGIYDNLQMLKIPDDMTFCEIFENFITNSNKVFTIVAIAVAKSLHAKDIQKIINTDIFKKLMPYDNWYYEGENSVAFTEFALSSWMTDFCRKSVQSIGSFVTDEDINRLNQLDINNLEDLKENLDFKYGTINYLISDVIDEAIKYKNNPPKIWR